MLSLGILFRHKFVLAILGTSPLWVGLLLFIYGPNNGTHILQDNSDKPSIRTRRNMDDMNKALFWNNADMTKLDLPSDIKEDAKDIQILESKIKVLAATVFYREAQPEKAAHITVLLLHGMRFSSKTWLDLGTIALLAKMGYRVVAVDLPGYGESPSAKVDDRAEFLRTLISNLNLSKPVVVSPSMSGMFALPYLLKHWKDMGGYIPVAPVGWEVLEKHTACETKGSKGSDNVPDLLKTYLTPPVPDLSCIEAPTLVVYGEHDRSRSSALLCLLPFSQPAEIPNGAHPAYLTDPDLWHKLLYNFLIYTNTYAEKKKH